MRLDAVKCERVRMLFFHSVEKEQTSTRLYSVLKFGIPGVFQVCKKRQSRSTLLGRKPKSSQERGPKETLPY
ncbi:hypothetical protein EVAR_86156_1 [Eumeta japonica]|uniref:Uncharacterized protein n=1 Tax=Eumeta variegata TaxID=151549 RepID=A0A4C1Z4C1_EUMVA|nr:hypothetical protein EVAR_86156_1 [Eumeta japonica]